MLEKDQAEKLGIGHYGEDSMTRTRNHEWERCRTAELGYMDNKLEKL